MKNKLSSSNNVNNFDGNYFSVSDMGRKKYSETETQAIISVIGVLNIALKPNTRTILGTKYDHYISVAVGFQEQVGNKWIKRIIIY